MTAKILPYLVVYMPLAKTQDQRVSMMPFDEEVTARQVFAEYTTGYAEWVVLVDPEDNIVEKFGDSKRIDAAVTELQAITNQRALIPGNTPKELPSG